VLDLGCGPGVTTAQLVERYEVTAVDISDAQVALARRAAPGARFVVADMTEVELPARSSTPSSRSSP
jgi:trans-aconitate methyltransferase